MVGGGTDYFKFKLFFNITVITKNVKFHMCINKFLKITSFLNIIKITFYRKIWENRANSCLHVGALTKNVIWTHNFIEVEEFGLRFLL